MRVAGAVITSDVHTVMAINPTAVFDKEETEIELDGLDLDDPACWVKASFIFVLLAGRLHL